MDMQALANITDMEALRAIIAAQAQQLADAEAETNKRDRIIDLPRAQLTLLRHGK